MSTRLSWFTAILCIAQSGPIGATVAEEMGSELFHRPSSISQYGGLYFGGGVASGFGPALYLYNGPGSGVQPFDHSSPSAFGYAGLNMVHDRFVLGVELSVSTDMFSEDVYIDGLSTLREVAAPTASARVGTTIGPLLAYLRVGAGMSFLNLWSNTEVRDFTFPSAAVAAGLEYELDPIFVRIEGEARHVFLSPIQYTFDRSDSLTTYRAGMSIGARLRP